MAGRRLLFCQGAGRGMRHGLPALLTWIMKNMLVSNPPWGPPQGTFWKDDTAPLYLEHMVLPVRYD